MTATAPGVLIVGGSIGGLRTAETVRRLECDADITILEASAEFPYDRTALSKRLVAADGELASVALRTQQDLDDVGIWLRRNARAVALDPARRTVRLADGELIEYSTLVVATGARPRELAGAPGSVTYYLRTLDDARALRQALPALRRVVVVGAGFIGSEVASGLAARGIEVIIVEPAEYPLGRSLGPAIGSRLVRLHEQAGVQLELGRGVSAVRESISSRFRAEVRLDDGRWLECDAAVVGIGARPNTEWLDGSGLADQDGVGCDRYCRAAAPDIFAVGDVARWPNGLFAESMRVEHWTNAVEQADIVAWNIIHVNEMREFSSVPYVWSDQYGVRMQIVGRPRPSDEVHILEEDVATNRVVAGYVRDGVLRGAFVMNAPARTVALRRLVGERAALRL